MSIVIIGGGVIGLSAAYHLARKGAAVTLLEKDSIGSGSSTRAAGIITGQLWTETGVRARKISLRRFRELSDELDGYQFQGIGALNLFDTQSWPERAALLPLYDRLEAPYEILDAAEIARRWPELETSHKPDLIGLFDPLGGYSEPQRYVPALAAKARELGVEIREGQIVTGFVQDGDRFTGVQTQDGLVPADAIISATHIWTNRLLENAGYQLPMRAIVHQRYVTTPLSAPTGIPVVNANPYGGYFRPAEGGRILAGYETPNAQPYPVPSLDFQMTELSVPEAYPVNLKANLLPLMPRLSDTSWETEKVGLLSFSGDGEPILGQLAPGLIVAGSFHSGGFAYNPVVGLLLSELALGEAPSVDLTTFAPTRFLTGDADQVIDTTSPTQVRRRH